MTNTTNFVFKKAGKPTYHSPFTVEVRKKVPLRNRFEIRPDQQKVIEWMINREENHKFGIKGGILAIDPGLGKTLDFLTLSLLRPKTTSTLIVVQKTLVGQTVNQIKNFFGKKVNWVVLHPDWKIFGGADPTTITSEKVLNYHFVVTTYDILVKYGDSKIKESTIIVNKVPIISIPKIPESSKSKGYEILYSIPWDRIIFDETHEHLVNPKTKKWLSAFVLFAHQKWCISGTFIKNKTADFWAQIRVCGYTSISNEKEWNRLGAKYYEINNLSEVIYTQEYKGREDTTLEEHRHKIKFDPETLKTYREYLEKTQREVSLYEKRESEYLHVLKLFTRLRQTCINPSIITEKVKYTVIPPKYEKCKEILEFSQAKTVVFSSYTQSLEGLSDYLRSKKIGCKVLSSKVTDREGFLEEFKTSEDRVLCSTFKLGGTGLNLQFITQVIILDPQWNESSIRQAYQRCWRTGQTDNVKVHYLTMENSIEEKIYELCEIKKSYRENFEDHLVNDEKIRMTVESIKSLL